MIVQSFGTSWKMEDDGALCKRSSSRLLCVAAVWLTRASHWSPDMAAMKTEIAYAHSKKVEIGGVRATLSLGSTPLDSTFCAHVWGSLTRTAIRVQYDLIDLDRGGLGYDQEEISPDGTVGGSACFASKWLGYFDPLVTEKITETGLDMVETDGPCQFARAP